MSVGRRLDRFVECRQCGARHDGALGLDGANHEERLPTGAYVLCITCGSLGVVPKRGNKVRQPSADEYEKFLSQLSALKAMYVVRARAQGERN